MTTFIDRTIAPVLSLPRLVKRGIALTVDVSLSTLAVWLAFYLRLGEFVTLSQAGWPAVVAATALAPPIFIVFGLYRAVFRYLEMDALIAVTQAVLVYGLVYSAIFTAWGVPGVPRTIGIIQPAVLLILVAMSRALGRFWLGGLYARWSDRPTRKRVAIYGAGLSGRQLANALTYNTGTEVVCFIDEDKALHDSSIGGVPVRSPEHLGNTVKQLSLDEIYLAIPSATRARRNAILAQIRRIGVSVKPLPGLREVAEGRVTISDVRPLEVEDLLGREAVAPDENLLSASIRDHNVMVTGAGGSIGSELSRQILRCQPRRLVLVDSSEFALYSIHSELQGHSLVEDGTVELVPLLASVCDRGRMEQIFQVWRPQTVYHAAAYKHVPLVEQNVVEGIRNNVFGTLNTAELAARHGVERFVLISTDKAVRPTNVMGATKRLAELVLQGMAGAGSQTCFTMVRFGNVLGSSGSVVPVFRQQIAAGGPITLTHSEITRFFMTIPEASQLVIQAGTMAKGGEVFVLDMGEPVRIRELATRMIELSGLRVRNADNPDGDIEIVVTGLRPGEKLYEELLIGESPVATAHPRVMKANEKQIPLATLRHMLETLRAAVDAQDSDSAKRQLHSIVPEFVSPDGNNDLSFRAATNALTTAPRGRVLPLNRSS